MRINVQEKLLDFICQVFCVEVEEIDLNKSLIDEGIIDSFGLIEISSFLENTFSIEVAETEMIRENFGSVCKIVDYTWRKMHKDE